MKLDKELIGALEDGRRAGAEGAEYRANPHIYTSAMSDAWALGHWLEVTRRILDVAKVVGMSSRGLVYDDKDGRRFRFRTSYVPCTAGHAFARSAV